MKQPDQIVDQSHTQKNKKTIPSSHDSTSRRPPLITFPTWDLGACRGGPHSLLSGPAHLSCLRKCRWACGPGALKEEVTPVISRMLWLETHGHVNQETKGRPFRDRPSNWSFRVFVYSSGANSCVVTDDIDSINEIMVGRLKALSKLSHWAAGLSPPPNPPMTVQVYNAVISLVSEGNLLHIIYLLIYHSIFPCLCSFLAPSLSLPLLLYLSLSLSLSLSLALLLL